MVGTYLADFTPTRESAHSQTTGAPAGYLQRFTGGECREGSRLFGGLSALVTTHCGMCSEEGEDAAAWKVQHQSGPSGLTICRFSFADCTAHVSVALDPKRCPAAVPRFRMGLDVGTAPLLADVVRDGAPTVVWDPRRSRRCPHASHDDLEADLEAASATCPLVSAKPTGTLTLWVRVLSGRAVIHLDAPQVVADDGVGGHGGNGGNGGVSVSLASGSSATMVLTGDPTSPTQSQPKRSARNAYEPGASSIVIRHECHGTSAAPGATAFGVHAMLRVDDHVPIPLRWRVRCAPRPGAAS